MGPARPRAFVIKGAEEVSYALFLNPMFSSGNLMCEQLQQMQRLQLAGSLAGGIAHDLNNELTLILGNLDLALDQLPVGCDVCDSLEQAKSAASRCADMSRRLLSFSSDRRTRMV